MQPVFAGNSLKPLPEMAPLSEAKEPIRTQSNIVEAPLQPVTQPVQVTKAPEEEGSVAVRTGDGPAGLPVSLQLEAHHDGNQHY